MSDAAAICCQSADLYFRHCCYRTSHTNADFHRLVAAGAGNRRLSEVVLVLEGQMRLGLRQVSSDRDQPRRGLAEHQAILDAITGHEPDAAERLMRQHIRHTRETLALQLG